MGLRAFLSSCSRLLKRAVKPGRKELWLTIKMCALGMTAVGVIAFIIRYIASVLIGG